MSYNLKILKVSCKKSNVCAWTLLSEYWLYQLFRGFSFSSSIRSRGQLSRAHAIKMSEVYQSQYTNLKPFKKSMKMWHKMISILAGRTHHGKFLSHDLSDRIFIGKCNEWNQGNGHIVVYEREVAILLHPRNKYLL